MTKLNQNKITLKQKLMETKEFHAYPKNQHTPKGSKPKACLDSKIDFITAIKEGAVIGYLDICMLGVPKSAFKALQNALHGATYSPYETRADLCVVDKMYYTTKHMKADEAGIPCITFDEVLSQIWESKDKDVKKFLENEGKVIVDKVTSLFLDTNKTKTAATTPVKKFTWMKK